MSFLILTIGSFLIVAVAWGISRILIRKLFAVDVCECGYSLEGLAKTNRCPECGEQRPHSQVYSRTRLACVVLTSSVYLSCISPMFGLIGCARRVFDECSLTFPHATLVTELLVTSGGLFASLVPIVVSTRWIIRAGRGRPASVWSAVLLLNAFSIISSMAVQRTEFWPLPILIYAFLFSLICLSLATSWRFLVYKSKINFQ